ncbi:hypothetical protein SAMN04515671_2742 [Nakamurella panacisegetis]|uniref:Uncharacterized protein n=1 Tax=Nakamurella panacisegetis TaxID=1090615 RepID=A0A1H0PF99_9ACTN|nr:hypothetical protein SAMN04515671_2742 [Nakamurella panacisegetis]
MPVQREVPTLVLPSGGAWLRILLILACVLIMVNLFVHGQGGGQNFLQWTIAVSLTLWVAIRPASSAPVVLLLLTLVMQVFFGKAQLDGRLITLVLLLPLVHQLSALAAVVPLRSAVRWPALIPSVVRCLGAVLVTVLGLLLSHGLGWW